MRAFFHETLGYFHLVRDRCNLQRTFITIFVGIFFISILTIVQFNPTVNISLQHEYIKLGPRICCLILTTPKNFATRAVAVNRTWAPRCDRYYFVTEFPKLTMSSIELQFGQLLPIASIDNILSGYSHLTKKSALAFIFAYEHHRDDFDWFVKADDDTYLIVENLRAFLREQNTSEPITFGYNFKPKVPGGYHSGGASYVLSREALQRFHNVYTANTSNQICSKDGGYEDVEIAKCLRSQGVYTGKSLDKYDRELFHPLRFHDLFSGNVPDWMYSYSENSPRKDYNCCSDATVSFHYMSPADQYFTDFLLYQVRSPTIQRRSWIQRFNISKRRSRVRSE